jgi:hypothetical protein
LENLDDLQAMLAGGDRRSIGRAGDVLARLTVAPILFSQLIEGMQHPSAVVRMRCADVAEKYSAAHPEVLRPFRLRLIDLGMRSEQQEVRWHLAVMLPRLALNAVETGQVYAILCGYLTDRSRIVRTFAMQGLADLAALDRGLIPGVLAILEECMRDGSPAMRSRGKKLIARLAKIDHREVGSPAKADFAA